MILHKSSFSKMIFSNLRLSIEYLVFFFDVRRIPAITGLVAEGATAGWKPPRRASPPSGRRAWPGRNLAVPPYDVSERIGLAEAGRLHEIDGDKRRNVDDRIVWT